MKKKQHIFHGGCHGCTQQHVHLLKFCAGCQFFDADWNLPDLSNAPPVDMAKKTLQGRIKSLKYDNGNLSDQVTRLKADIVTLGNQNTMLADLKIALCDAGWIPPEPF